MGTWWLLTADLPLQTKFLRVTKNRFSLFFEWLMWRLSLLNGIHALSINFVQQSKFYDLGWYIFSIRKVAGTLVLPQKPASWALALQTLHWRCEYLLHWYTLHWRCEYSLHCNALIHFALEGAERWLMLISDWLKLGKQVIISFIV